ncbi:lytic murein transglycosylase, partial [Rhizobium ruizarguesonis]
SIERRFGVPAGPLISIWGMETGFGSFMVNQHTLSAVSTLAYDCRRSEYFTMCSTLGLRAQITFGDELECRIEMVGE